MDPVSEQVLHAFLDGADQGTAKVVALGTSATAAAAWHKFRTMARRHRPVPDAAEFEVLEAEPGQDVDIDVLRRLVEMLSPAEQITVHGDYVAGDKTITVHGNYIADRRLW